MDLAVTERVKVEGRDRQGEGGRQAARGAGREEVGVALALPAQSSIRQHSCAPSSQEGPAPSRELEELGGQTPLPVPEGGGSPG